jgi:hypothetical protein
MKRSRGWRGLIGAVVLAFAALGMFGGAATAAPFARDFDVTLTFGEAPLADAYGWRGHRGGWHGGHRGYRHGWHRGYRHGWHGGPRWHHRPYYARPYHRPYRPRAVFYGGPVYGAPVYGHGPRCFWRPARYVYTAWGPEFRPARRICRW